MRDKWDGFTRYEWIERVVFLVALIVLILDIFVWRAWK